MNSIQIALSRSRLSLKLLSLLAAASAVAVMGAVTVTIASSSSAASNAVFFADTTTETTPPATPGVASAAPKVKATTFAGGDWPGLGTFGEDWAK